MEELQEAVENALKVLEDIHGRRPRDRMEFFIWSSALDRYTRVCASELESKLGVKTFTKWLLAFDPGTEGLMNPEDAKDCGHCDNGVEHQKCDYGWKEHLREHNRARILGTDPSSAHTIH